MWSCPCRGGRTGRSSGGLRQKSSAFWDTCLPYIYKIRDNVFFHDKPPVNGRQLTADDMAANYERLLGIGRFAGQERSPVTFGTVLIPIESITATDELTFEIKLSQPLRDAHQRLFDDSHIYARPPETFDTLDDANTVIGTGPFIMDKFVSDTSVTFDRNPNYWKDDERFPGNRLPYVDRLVMLVMGEASQVDRGEASIAGPPEKQPGHAALPGHLPRCRTCGYATRVRSISPGRVVVRRRSSRSELATRQSIRRRLPRAGGRLLEGDRGGGRAQCDRGHSVLRKA